MCAILKAIALVFRIFPLMSTDSAPPDPIAAPLTAAVKVCVRRRPRAALSMVAPPPLAQRPGPMSLFILWFAGGSRKEPGPARPLGEGALRTLRSFVSVLCAFPHGVLAPLNEPSL